MRVEAVGSAHLQITFDGNTSTISFADARELARRINTLALSHEELGPSAKMERFLKMLEQTQGEAIVIVNLLDDKARTAGKKAAHLRVAQVYVGDVANKCVQALQNIRHWADNTRW